MKVKNYLWTLAAALTLVGCSDDLETQKGGPEEGTEQAKGEYYLYFSLDTPETKASDNPTGGEEGDGNEAGTYAENYVENVALFFVERTKGIQDAGAKIVGKLFIGEDELTHPEETAATTNYVKTIEPILISEKYYSVIKDEIDKKNTPRYAVLAITNLADGDQNAFYAKITEGTSTVKDLQDAVIAEGKTNSNGEKGSFVMSSSGESYVTFDQYNNSKESPARLSVTVERLSARIDFKATLVNEQKEANVYPIYAKDKDGNTDKKNQIASVQLTEMAVVNQFKGNVYDFKRVSAGVNTNMIEWLGDDMPIAGVQKNYVLDYDFKKKTIEADGSVSMNLEARSIIYKNPVFARDTKTYPTLAAYWGEYFSTGNVYTLTDETTYERAMYVNENTTIAEAQKNGYSTGVVFKGTATILKAYERKFATTSHEEVYVEKIAWSTEDLKEDDLVYMYKGMPYKDLESIQQLFVQKPMGGELEGDAVDKTATGWDFAGEAGVKAVAEINSLAELETYKGYFASTDLGYRKYLDEKYAELKKIADATTINWDEVQAYISWQTYKDDKLSSEENLNNLYDIKQGTVTAVDCYYPYWIRHSNNMVSYAMGIMEFGIVRNNIYKLSVKSLNGFGITELDPDTPDEDVELYLEVDLYVEDWVLRYNEDIEL